MASPLKQFEIKKLININLFDVIDISFTNSSLFLLLATIIGLFLLIWPLRKKYIIPNKWQMFSELVYDFIKDMVVDVIGKKGLKFLPLVLSLFLFIFLCNFLGLLPYSFTVTSHLIITLSLGLIVFLSILFYGFYKHKFKFLGILLPSGTPIFIAPLMVVIELFSFLARPITLALRLAANMTAGHILLKVLAGFIPSLGFILGWAPLILIILFIGFEAFVAILQAYIFATLSCVYLNDAVNLH